MRRIFSSALVATVLAVVPLDSADAGNPSKGQKIYDANCASCHGPDGMALVPGTPHFRKNERMEKPDGVLLKTIRSGKNLMPAWRGTISENDMLDAIAYVRTLAR